MKKVLLLSLIFSLILSSVSVFTVCAKGDRTYGVDNLNDEPGDLYIGFIGGSITEGAHATGLTRRYTTRLVNNYFKTKFPEKTVYERNVAMGGTPSEYGHLRIKRDLQLGTDKSPDVVFVEFAVNDTDIIGNGGTKAQVQSYVESIVTQLLASPKIPVIVFVYAASTAREAVETSISYHSEIAKRYGIYEINLYDYIWEGVESGKWAWKEDDSGLMYLFGDGVHPNDNGYKVYADRIGELLEQDYEKVFVKHNPDTEPVGEYVFNPINQVHLKNAKLSSGWKLVRLNPADNPFMAQGDYLNRFFTEGYYKTDNCVGETIEYEFEGRGFGINLLRTKNNGSLQWKVYDENGNLEDSGVYTCYYKYQHEVCLGKMIKTGLPEGKHKLVLTGALNEQAIIDKNENDEHGGTGTYLAVAYIAIEENTPVPAGDFSDAIGHWAETDICNMAKKGIVSGVSEGIFQPERYITRAEFATVIVKLLGLESLITDKFSDIPSDSWYAPFVGAAANAGIISGSNGLFRPNDTITRQEMAVVIVKAAEFSGEETDSGSVESFTDKDEIAPWAASSVGKAERLGLMSGMGNGNFAPAGLATRAQAASIINRLYSLVK